MSVNSRLKATTIIGQSKAFYRQRIPEFCFIKNECSKNFRKFSEKSSWRISLSVKVADLQFPKGNFIKGYYCNRLNPSLTCFINTMAVTINLFIWSLYQSISFATFSITQASSQNLENSQNVHWINIFRILKIWVILLLRTFLSRQSWQSNHFQLLFAITNKCFFWRLPPLCEYTPIHEY